MNLPPAYAATIDLARRHLAQRLGMSPSEIHFVSLSADEFPADTLGCMGPGVSPRPIPAMVSGQVIILRAAGARYTYHARRDQVIFCGPW